MGKKGWRSGEGAEHWSSRVNWLEGSEERTRIREEHQERQGEERKDVKLSEPRPSDVRTAPCAVTPRAAVAEPAGS